MDRRFDDLLRAKYSSSSRESKQNCQKTSQIEVHPSVKQNSTSLSVALTLLYLLPRGSHFLVADKNTKHWYIGEKDICAELYQSKLPVLGS